jgi:hypothetical protein
MHQGSSHENIIMNRAKQTKTASTKAKNNYDFLELIFAEILCALMDFS